MATERLIEVMLRDKCLGGIRIMWDEKWNDGSTSEDSVWLGKLMWATDCVEPCIEAIENEIPIQGKFLLACRCIVEALNDGKRNEKREGELAQMYMTTYGLGIFVPGDSS